MATRTCSDSPTVLRRGGHTGVPIVKGVCMTCIRHYHRTGTVSFSSLLVLAFRLFESRRRVERGCTNEFSCVLISRCRSAGRIRVSVIVRLYGRGLHIYTINSSSRDVCDFHNTGVSGVLGCRGRLPKARLFGLRRGCQSARAVMRTTGDLVRRGHGRVRGRIFDGGSGKRGVLCGPTCDSGRRTLVITGGVRHVGQRSSYKCSRFTVLCHAGTRDHDFRRRFQGRNVPCHVCNKLDFCRHGRVGSVVTCFHLITGPSSRRTFGHVVGCPTHNVNTAAIAGVTNYTRRGRIDF